MKPVYEAVADAIVASGADVVFGLMGEGNLELISTIAAAEGVTYYTARHEAGAVGMADGYARVSGRVGICTVTQGPGLTNALTPLIAAQRNRTPLLLIAPDTPHGEETHPQLLDVHMLATLAGVRVYDLDAPSAVTRIFGRALQDSADGPVMLRIPNDIQKLPTDDVPARIPALEKASVRRECPSDAAIVQACDTLRNAGRVVIVAGEGAVASAAHAELIALGERLGGLLATSLRAKGWFNDDPFNIGVCGGFATPLAFDLIGSADCILAFGASLNPWQTGNGKLLKNATVVHCDNDRGAIGRYAPADIALQGDVRETATALLAALVANVNPQPGYRTADIATRIATWDPLADMADDVGEAPLDPRLVAATLDRMLPRDRALVVDGGHFTGYPCTYVDVDNPRSFVFAIDFGATGLGLSAALGAAIAQPDRITLLTIGDGGLLMSIAELESAARYKLPLVIAVFNDGAYGSEVHHLRMRGLAPDAAYYPVPPFAEIARVVGADGVAVRTLAELEQLHIDGVPDRPLLLDIRIDGEIMANWFSAFAARAATTGHWT